VITITRTFLSCTLLRVAHHPAPPTSDVLVPLLVLPSPTPHPLSLMQLHACQCHFPLQRSTNPVTAKSGTKSGRSFPKRRPRTTRIVNILMHKWFTSIGEWLERRGWWRAEGTLSQGLMRVVFSERYSEGSLRELDWQVCRSKVHERYTLYYFSRTPETRKVE